LKYCYFTRNKKKNNSYSVSPASVIDEHGSGPLHWAAAKGHYEIAQLFLENSFPPSAQYHFFFFFFFPEM